MQIKKSTKPQTPTEEAYEELQYSYSFFNERLFDGQLPPCLITLQREKNTLGYFSKERFVRRTGELTHEIAMNPAYFAVRPLKETLSTLVHEQVHLWQAKYGTPGRGRYHNAEWADKMEAIGLQPYASSGPKRLQIRTGDCVTHYIIEGGRFDRASDELLAMTDSQLVTWLDRCPAYVYVVDPSELEANAKPVVNEPEGQSKPPSLVPVEVQVRTMEGRLAAIQSAQETGCNIQRVPKMASNRAKYRCPECGAQVWGKPGLSVGCLDHPEQEFVPVMEEEW